MFNCFIFCHIFVKQLILKRIVIYYINKFKNLKYSVSTVTCKKNSVLLLRLRICLLDNFLLQTYINLTI